MAYYHKKNIKKHMNNKSQTILILIKNQIKINQVINKKGILIKNNW